MPASSDRLPPPGATNSCVTVDGVRASYSDAGPRSAPTVIMLHGVPGSSADFRYLGPHVSPYARVLCLDLPGFGHSECPKRFDHNPEARADWVLRAADALAVRRFAVLGHSVGGAVALTLGARHSGRVTAVALVASVGLRRHRAYPGPPWLLATIVAAARMPGLDRLYAHATRRMYRRLRMPSSTVNLSRQSLHVHGRTVAAIDFHDLARSAAGLHLPTLVVHAEDDRLVQPEIARELTAAVAGATLTLFPQGGHNIQKTRAAELGQLLHGLLLGTRADVPPRH